MTEKDRHRLEHWKSDAEMVGFSDRETERFRSAFDEILTRKRYTLLYQNPIERLNAMNAGMATGSASTGTSSRATRPARGEIADRIRQHRERFDQILLALQSSLSGVVPKIREQVGADVNRFLDPGRAM